MIAAENDPELGIDRDSISLTVSEVPAIREINEYAHNAISLGLQDPEETPQTSQSCETLRRSWRENKLLCSVWILGSTAIAIYGIVKRYHP